jgi:hypothetical protein
VTALWHPGRQELSANLFGQDVTKWKHKVFHVCETTLYLPAQCASPVHGRIGFQKHFCEAVLCLRQRCPVHLISARTEGELSIEVVSCEKILTKE